ncbi:MAG TPA: alpha/beta family hydrolase [Candidatus Saccharimonadales bacterium]|nr:alpha/beta family hydrolase [Candidatus Saccharimonadales bacterium]
MNLLLFAGAGRQSEAWLQRVDASLAHQYEKTYRHSYAHWESGAPDIDLDLEIGRLAAITENVSPFMIFAKSAGTMLVSRATALGILRPEACLFTGIPLIMIRDQQLPANRWLQATEFPMTILQHTDDPYGSYEEVKQYIAGTARTNAEVHEIPGDTHDYLEFDLIKSYAASLLRET